MNAVIVDSSVRFLALSASLAVFTCSSLAQSFDPGWIVTGQGMLAPQSVASDESGAAPQQQQRGRGRGAGRGAEGVYKSQVVPHWFANNTRFWYRNDLKGGAKEFLLVDAEKGARQPAFDHARLASSLSKAADQEFKADRLPFSGIEFVEDGNEIKFDAAGKTWKCDLSSYECAATATNTAANAPLTLPTASGSATPRLVFEDSRDIEGEASAEAGEEEGPAPQQQEAQTQAQEQGQGRGQRGQGTGRGRGFGGRGANQGPRTSPDGKWIASIKEFNVSVRSEADGTEFQLSHDGVTNNAYGRLEWSPDSKALVAWRIESGDYNPVYLIRSSPPGGGLAQFEERHYEQAGNQLTSYELSVFDITGRKQIKPEVERVDFGSPSLRWNNSHFTYQKVERGHQRFRVVEVDARTGAVRNLIDEQTKTFIWTAHNEALTRRNLPPVTYLEKTGEMIYASEQDGWRHLYLVSPGPGDAATLAASSAPSAPDTPTMKQITQGHWVVRGLEQIDEEKRQIWFQASGVNPDQDPYFIHYYRVNFDGTGLIALTEGNGTHTIEFSPDRKYILDTYSRVDAPPVNDLRRAADGKLICKLEEADISELKATGWKPPEVFVAKARDGKTDIWGIVCRPRDYDPNKKYPVLEDIYAGPHDSFAPKSFSGGNRYQAYNELGFIVVKLDGMGTANRSKAFHDVCWKDIKDAGFPDRILWIKAAAEKYPHLDITRVGIYGTSAGGQNAAAAVLFHPEFYKAAAANCGCHDNRIDKRSWNEQWMGFMPKDKIWSNDPDNWYSQCSNIDNAAKLKGRLLLIVGEMDSNVPPESTLRFVDALIKARKDFEMLVVPGANHGAGSPVTGRRTQDFFVRHLLGDEPPDRNNSSGTPAGS